MLKAPQNDIIYSKKWGKQQWLSYFQERYSAMKSKKAKFEAEFKQYEEQETAISYYDNQGNLQVNLPIEQNLIEIYMGRTNGKVSYDIVPDGQANIDELQPAKYALQFVLD